MVYRMSETPTYAKVSKFLLQPMEASSRQAKRLIARDNSKKVTSRKIEQPEDSAIAAYTLPGTVWANSSTT